MKSWRLVEGPPSSARRFALPVVLLVAFALRLYRIGDANLWWDEALAVWAIRKGLLGATLWTASDVHPPLYFWSLWGWVQLVGESEFAMRILSLSFGLLTVAVAYPLGRKVGGELVGILASLFTGVARFHVWWSQEMRMYVLAGLFLTLSLYGFIRWLESALQKDEQDRQLNTRAARWLAICALANVAALYTLYLSAVILVVESLVLALAWWQYRSRRRFLVRQWLVSQGAVVIVVAAWLWFSTNRMRTWSVAEPVSLSFVIKLYLVLLATGVSVEVERALWAIVPSIVVIAMGLVLWLRQRKRLEESLNVLMLVLGWTMPLFVVYWATLPRSLFYTPHIEARYFLPFAPVFWLFLAWATAQLYHWRREVGCVAGILLVGCMVSFLPGYYRGRCLRDELQTMVRAIASQAEPGDAVVLDSGGRYPLFLYYYERLPEAVWRPPVLTVSRKEELLRSKEVQAWAQDQLPRYRRVWLAEVDAHLTDPNRLIYQVLSERYQLAWDESYGYNHLYLFAPGGAAPVLTPDYTPQHSLDLPFADGHLLGWELPLRVFCPGESLRLALLWAESPDQALYACLEAWPDLRVFCRQMPPCQMGIRCRRRVDLPLVATLPPGRYRLVLRSSDGLLPLTGIRLRGGDGPQILPPQKALDAQVMEGLALCGYRVHMPSQLHPGDEVFLDLYWEALSTPKEDYTVFTHLLGDAFNPRSQGPIWGQHDSPPVEGRLPTSAWRQGDWILDRHRLLVDEQAPPGIYRFEIGLYRSADGERLVFRKENGEPGGDHLLLDVSVPVVSR